MASLPTKASSNSGAATVGEKGSRNKRKFRAETPLADSKMISESQSEGPNYEFAAGKFDNVQSHSSSSGCETSNTNRENVEALQLDLGLSCAATASEVGQNKCRTEIETRQAFQNADWNNPNESELEKLVKGNLHSNLKSAIKRIVAYGYSEEVAFTALSKAGQIYGAKDTVANLVDSTLAFLRAGQATGGLRDCKFPNFAELEKFMIEESIYCLKQMRPIYSTGEAMWFLLVCDMNLSLGCVTEIHQSSMVGNEAPNGTSSVSTSVPSCTGLQTLEANFVRPIDVLSEETKVVSIPSVGCSDSTAEATKGVSNASVGCFTNDLSEATEVISNSYGHTFQSEAPIADVSNLKSKDSMVSSGLLSEKEFPTPGLATAERTFSLGGAPHIPISEEKFIENRKVSGITKREYILQQKSLHLEKHHRTYGSKGSSRTGKLNQFGGLVLDKKLRHISDSTCVNTRNTFKIGSSIGANLPQETVNHNLKATIGFPSVPTFNVENDSALSISSEPIETSLLTPNTSPALLAADTELSLSMPVNCNTELSNISYSVVPIDKSTPDSVPDDNKDEMIRKLVSRVRELHNQLQEWTEWANQKVMQAAHRLGKDKAELKALRQEREEVERLKKEKQVLEENTLKKLSEMENALAKASGQVERANAAVRRLEVENAALRQEMEIAKSRAAESAASLEVVSKREKENKIKFQSREKQKAILQEDLAAENRKFLQLKQKLEQAEDLRDQLEARWNQEAKAKEELLSQASVLKKEREQIEASVKSREETMKSKGETNLHKHKDEIEKLEKEISQIRLKTDSSKIAALKSGIDGSYASRLTKSKNTLTPPEEFHARYISKSLTDFEDYSGIGGVKRERECVMCLSEEMSIVFLPCAHQVVCTMCNELHEKQGMEDCPSCRSVIQQRICVRFAHS